ncbi:MAG: sigma-70 family RNA polymerase sigma factor [Alicyclobacillus macrosporangiidus]|uniref:sigma-70 family RNA polymerase sigma factor n=1 Tax=Alicyclobacillus macrosporangiidus TaxID=392015 RepID=UPI0026ED456B|nr:sigma-70 family RNA polymerase sigma factor [Alicyclobacillus macrosporangiidus]MCL6600194.1 sigma-70 family RNA polymerase sigma factor [Alicyclobacillus macrosporangiidus]
MAVARSIIEATQEWRTEAEEALATLSDEQLVAAFRNGNGQAISHLFERYRHFIYSKASMYYLNGGSVEDLQQEGRIGLYEAVQVYRPGGPPFAPFAKLCITRQILQAVRIANNRKNKPLNTAVSLDEPIRLEPDEEESSLLNLLEDKRTPLPEDVVIYREQWNGLSQACDTRHLPLRKRNRNGANLTELERNVLLLYAAGYSYEEMSQRLNKSCKSIDNALQRAKHKLAQYLERW